MVSGQRRVLSRKHGLKMKTGCDYKIPCKTSEISKVAPRISFSQAKGTLEIRMGLIDLLKQQRFY